MPPSIYSLQQNFTKLHAHQSMVDSWRAVIGAQAHLSQWFVKPDGKPDDAYKASVKRRFVQWVIDVAFRAHDQNWLNYQHEIGLRHTPAKKNRTDNAQTPPLVPFPYLLGFVPIILPIRKFSIEEIPDDDELKNLAGRVDEGRASSRSRYGRVLTWRKISGDESKFFHLPRTPSW